MGVLVLAYGQLHANFITDFFAQNAYQKQDYQRSANYYQKQLQADYQDSAALYNLGASAYQLKDYRQAQQCFAKAAADASLPTKRRAEAYFNAANSSVQLGDYQKALEQYQQTLKFDPKDQRAKANYEKLKKQLTQQTPPPPAPSEPPSAAKDSCDRAGRSGTAGQAADQQQGQPEAGANPGDQGGQSDSTTPAEQASPTSAADQQQPSSGPAQTPQQRERNQSGAAQSDSGTPAPAQPATKGQSSTGQTAVPKSGSAGDHPGQIGGDPAQRADDTATAAAASETATKMSPAKLDQQSQQLLRAAQADDRAANRALLRYQLQQADGERATDEELNNW